MYYLLIKRRGAKRWKGVIPAKRGVSRRALVISANRRFGRVYTVRVVSKPVLLRIIMSQKGIR